MTVGTCTARESSFLFFCSEHCFCRLFCEKRKDIDIHASLDRAIFSVSGPCIMVLTCDGEKLSECLAIATKEIGIRPRSQVGSGITD